jgi:hypothetical protein
VLLTGRWPRVCPLFGWRGTPLPGRRPLSAAWRLPLRRPAYHRRPLSGVRLSQLRRPWSLALMRRQVLRFRSGHGMPDPPRGWLRCGSVLRRGWQGWLRLVSALRRGRLRWPRRRLHWPREWLGLWAALGWGPSCPAVLPRSCRRWPPGWSGHGTFPLSPGCWMPCFPTARWAFSSPWCWPLSQTGGLPPLASTGRRAPIPCARSLHQATQKRLRAGPCRRLRSAGSLTRWQARCPGHGRPGLPWRHVAD